MSREYAISAMGLGKRYRIGSTARSSYGSLRESLTRAAQAPLRRFSTSGELSSSLTELWALQNVSFTIQSGEAVGIVGRNGAGKSTLLKILSRITDPTTGRGEVIGRIGSLLEVGTGFHPELTGRENIFLNGAIMGMTRADITTQFDRIVDFAGVETYLDTPVKRYSSGMYMRLAFAVAAHLEPEILVVDEVLAVGDAEFQKKCLGKMGDVVNEGRTVLLVSHNMGAIAQLTTRALLLQNGHLTADGPTVDVVKKYLSIASDPSDGDLDLTEPALRRNSREDSQFKWTHLSILNSRGQLASMIDYQEPFEIVLHGTASSEIADPRLGLSVMSGLGYTLFTTFASDDQPVHLSHGSCEFRISFSPNILAPGVYELGLGANGPGVTDWLPTVGQFTVSAVSSFSDATWESYRGGIIRYPCTWSIRTMIGE